MIFWPSRHWLSSAYDHATPRRSPTGPTRSCGPRGRGAAGHPEAATIDGVTCYPSLGAARAGGRRLSWSAGADGKARPGAAAAGIGRVWMQQGAASEAAKFCRENGIRIHGECILMFAEPLAGRHRWPTGGCGACSASCRSERGPTDTGRRRRIARPQGVRQRGLQGVEGEGLPAAAGQPAHGDIRRGALLSQPQGAARTAGRRADHGRAGAGRRGGARCGRGRHQARLDAAGG